MIGMNRPKVCLDSPLYIGMCVLDMSKAFMYDTSSYAIENEFGIDRWNQRVHKVVMVKVVKKDKGVRKCVQRNITFDDFINCLRTRNNFKMQQRMIKSGIDNVLSVVGNRIVLSADDNKRYWLPDGINSRALGHYANNTS